MHGADHPSHTHQPLVGIFSVEVIALSALPNRIGVQSTSSVSLRTNQSFSSVIFFRCAAESQRLGGVVPTIHLRTWRVVPGDPQAAWVPRDPVPLFLDIQRSSRSGWLNSTHSQIFGWRPFPKKKPRRCLRGRSSFRLIPITRPDWTKLASLDSEVPTNPYSGHSAVKFCTDS